MAYKRDNPGVAHSRLATNLLNSVRFAQKVNKPIVDMSEDVLGNLDSLEKPESLDPTHKWKGFYNAFEITVTRFFKWFYHPDIDSDDRPKPAIVAGLKKPTR